MVYSFLCVLLFLHTVLSLQVCGTAPGRNFSVVETTITGNVSNILWLQQQNVFVLTDTENAYHSQDGGITWKDVSPESQMPIHGFLQMYSTSDANSVYLIADFKSGFNCSVWVYSITNHASYQQQLPRLAYLQPHSQFPDLAVALTAEHGLYVTGDRFQTVVFVDTNVSYGYWDSYQNYYYLTDNNDLKMVRAGVAPVLVSQNVHWLAAADNKLFITTTNKVGDLQLLSSSSSGWLKVNFPVTLKENMLNIVDVSVGSVIAVVVDENDHSRGDLYMSDDADMNFVEVLSNVVVQPGGYVDCKLLGVMGVILANQYVSGSNIQTLISFDNGGKWQPLTPPGGCAAQNECGVQLHMNDKQDTGPWGPLHTRSSAVGLVMATGNVGTALNTSLDGTSTFFSRTVGVQWASISLSSTTYEFTDHGALMVVADNVHPTNTIKYSWNEALSFEECQFSESLATVFGISVEPTATSQSFLLYGLRTDMTTALVYLDFSGLHERACNSSDYETWSVLGDNCILGQKLSYTRRKQTSECYIPLGYEPEQVSTKCPCTRDDYECDYCYTEQGDICVQSCPASSINTTCYGSKTVNKGYRLVPGTVCLLEGGLNLTPSVVECVPDDSNGNTGTNNVVVASVVTVVVVLVVLVGGAFLWRNERTRNWIEDRVRYGRYKLLGNGNRYRSSSLLLEGGDFYDEDLDEMDSDAPILNDEAIIQLSEESILG